MASLNRIILTGKVTGNPESRVMVDGQPIFKFQLPVNQRLVGGKPAEVELIDVVCWGRVAEVCSQYLKQNELVLVEGRIQNRSFNDETGQRKWVTEVIARTVQFLGLPQRAEAPAPIAPSAQNAEAQPEHFEEPFGLEEDLPF
jgi:single-strand DNA-binding protein